MNLVITPKTLKGEVLVPPSKSAGHRIVIASALAGGGKVYNITLSEDIKATLNCMKALGAVFSLEGNTVTFFEFTNVTDETITLDCEESGSTLRFLIPLALALYPNKALVFKGKGRLLERPLDVYFDIFKKHDIYYHKDSQSLTVKGELKAGEYQFSGKISSQFVTGFLYALSLLNKESKIVITDTLESKGYVDMTIDVLKDFGVSVKNCDYKEFIISSQKYSPCDITVEGDFSQGAFFYTANFIGSDISVLGLKENSKQGDKKVCEILESFKNNEDIILDVSDIPDLVPTLAIASAYREGRKTQFINGARLKMKESDRIKTTCEMLDALGAEVIEGDDSITVFGQKKLSPKRSVDCHNDHRIAMATAVACVGADKDISVIGAECVKKSYPNFWEDYKRLGGEIKEVGR